MKKERGKEGRREAQVDPRQRPLFEGWGRSGASLREPAGTGAYRREEPRDREG